MCYFSCRSSEPNKFEKHIVRSHKNDPNFIATCSVGNCNYATKSWGAFRTHIWRKHRLDDQDSDEDQLNGYESSSSSDESDGDGQIFDDQVLLQMVGKYSLSLQAQHGLTDNALKSVLVQTSVFIKDVVSAAQRIVQNVPAREANDTLSAFAETVEKDFLDFQSNHKRMTLYGDVFGYVKPVGITLGYKLKKIKGQIKRVSRIGYYIPFLDTLQQLLNLPEVQHFISHPHQSVTDMMYDICDGTAVRNHNILRQNPGALVFIISCDDIEIVNPIGVHTKKHKLTMFYWTLANIPPEHRSRLTSIQLLAVAKTEDLKFVRMGRMKLLQDFINAINALGGRGVQLYVNGRQQLVQGFLAIFPADTLAAQWIGGFKEGVGFAFKPCRTCEVTHEGMKNVLLESDVRLRNEAVHVERCSDLQNLSSVALKYWSKIWGINSSSCLLEINNFPLCSALVHDPMHVFLEGLIPHELNLLLCDFIAIQRYFTLAWLNGKLQNFPYTYLEEQAKVLPLSRNRLKPGNFQIKQTAAAMHNLCMILPFIIGPIVPEENRKWLNFLCLVHIMLLCFSPCADRNTVGQLEQLIYTHHSSYKEEYPRAPFIPKMHYCVHLPSQILKFGPARFHSCMRFEAKHMQTKGRKWKNFKNVPLSVCKNHQLLMCHMVANCAQNFLYEGDLVREGKEVLLHDKFPDLVEQFCTESGSEIFRDRATVLYETKSVTIHGHKFQSGCCLRLGYLDESPLFAKLLEIVVFQGEKYFIVDEMLVDYFEKQGMCFILRSSGRCLVTSYASLSCKWPLSFHRYSGQCAVINQYAHL